MRVFERLVLALGHRKDRDLGALAQIEQGRADEVADILDQDDRARAGLQLGEPARDHRRIEMAAGAGIDLDGRRAGRADALAVVRGRLIALQHKERQRVAQIADRAFEQRGLAGAGGADQVQRQDLAAAKPAAVLLRQRIVLGEDARFECYRRAVLMCTAVAVVVPVPMIVIVVMFMGMAVPGAVGVDVLVRRRLDRGSLSGLQIKHARFRLAAAAAGRAHQAASANSMLLIVSSRPCSRSRSSAPHAQEV